MGSQSTAKYSTLDVDVLDPAAASWAPSKFDGVHTQNRYSWRKRALETDLNSVPRINGTPITLRARTDDVVVRWTRVLVRWTRRAVGRAPAPRVRGYAGEVS